jgi:hypothetical protein
MKFQMSAPGQDWYVPEEESHASCVKCTDECYEDYADVALSLPCIFGLGSCWPGALAQWGACLALCNLPNNGCLPNPCGFFTTCHEKDTCFDYKDGQLCCESPAAVCDGVCCGKDVRKCSPDGSCGCTSQQTSCGNDCCDPEFECKGGVACCKQDQELVNGICCDKSSKCGDICCDALSLCADPKKGICCGFGFEVCGSQCCAPGGRCIDGKCCPHDQLCGGVCCPSGHTCKDFHSHRCVACSPKLVPCLPEGGIGLCCPPNVDCCADVCCKAGDLCQVDTVVNGQVKYKCGPPRIPK